MRLHIDDHGAYNARRIADRDQNAGSGGTMTAEQRNGGLEPVVQHCTADRIQPNAAPNSTLTAT